MKRKRRVAYKTTRYGACWECDYHEWCVRREAFYCRATANLDKRKHYRLVPDMCGVGATLVGALMAVDTQLWRAR